MIAGRMVEAKNTCDVPSSLTKTFVDWRSMMKI